MIIKVKTATGKIIRGFVASNVDAVRFLRNLAKEGEKCIRWEVEKGA